MLSSMARRAPFRSCPSLPLLRLGVAFLVFLFGARLLQAGGSLGLPTTIVADSPAPERFPLIAGGAAAPLWYDTADHLGVLRAIADLRADVERVSGAAPALSAEPSATPPASRPVIVGTLGRSSLIDTLVAAGKLDPAPLAGKWESFVIAVVEQPLPGVAQALVIAGSDKRGTIYGIYELSEQLGVSPWYWWADVPPRARSAAHILPGPFASGEPVVKYRGIFLNDEAPALTRWTDAKFGDRNRHFYTKVFELLLRLRANYLWPAMWGDAFNEDDPENPRLADEYGIVMGTSHHEPMIRAQQEWSRSKNSYGNAEWNYATNAEGLRAFWRNGVARNKVYENLVTIGMRGDGDEPMIVGGDMAANSALLGQIIADQRAILAEETGRPASDTPQLWALYKEVQEYYDHGLRPPEDVTLLWCDDNWGNIRRLPSTPEERNRSGGSGVYYHFDYVGGPRSYKWLNTNPLPKIQEQMNLAWKNDATRIWIVNVGDLKPMEVPIEFFLRMAWDPARWTADDCDDFLLRWAGREFGPVHAAEVAALVGGYTKLNGRRKPELVSPSTYSLLNYREADRALAEWRDLATRAQALHAALPPASRDAFYQLAVHPILACANLNELYVAAARNALHAAQSRASTNSWAARVSTLFQYDATLTNYWNTDFASGKWIHLMDQVHIGYTSWNDPPSNIMPAVTSYTAPAAADLGVALEGSATALGAGSVGTLPPLHSEGGASARHIDVFRRGTLDTAYSITANHPWVSISRASGMLGDDVRVEVGLDWARVPTGAGDVVLTIQGGSPSTTRTVRLPFVKAAVPASGLPVGFLDPEGFVAIEAPNYDRAFSRDGVVWKVLPDHGRSVGAVTTFPVNSPSISAPGGDSPRLEYDFYTRRRGELPVRIVVSPTLNYIGGQPLRCAISIDDHPPQIITVGAVADSGIWSTSVQDSVRAVAAAVIADEAGPHVFKFWMVDPGVVLQRIEIDTGGLKPSYLGPPESPRGRRALQASSGSGVSSGAVVVEAESGTLGAEMPAFTATVPAYISVSSTGGGNNPAGAARVSSYQVTFPAAGTYRLFARVRVGVGGANDDSFFVGNGFGAKNPAADSDWRMINNISGSGFANLADVVLPTGGSAGAGVWKWIDVGGLAGLTFTVPAGALVQTIQLGGREDGFDIDKLVFGPAANRFTVDDLAQGGGGSPASVVRVLEAEASQYGAELIATAGSPSYLSVSTTNSTVPGAAARVARFAVNFVEPGTYRLFARVRVGPGFASDDSLFVGNGFGAKDPALSADWRLLNNFAGSGYANASDAVESAGTAGGGVWKWLDLGALANLTFTVQAGALSRVLDLAGREDGLDIDKIVFAPGEAIYTVADLDAGIPGTSLSVAPVFTVETGAMAQTIDGFGASSAWTSPSLSSAQSDALFSPSLGLGLSLLRLRIAPNGTTSELLTAQRAIARGARVWATPWSPPAEWKSNNDASNGGTLLPERYADWAARLADFAQSMKNSGVTLVALSAQNEPNYTATWESCVWTPTTMTTFIRDHLGPALVSRGLSTRVLAPEVVNANGFPSFANALLNDSVARSYLSHLALHCYGAEPTAFPAAAANGVGYWQTEFTDDGADSDPGMDSALRVSDAIHKFLTVSQGNAWHYWWITPNPANAATTGSLYENSVLAKRAYALGNWARFVRPGHVRVQTHGSDDMLKVSAYISPTSRRLSIIVVNSDLAARTVPLALSGGTAPSLTPWETSATRSLAPLAPIMPAADGSFTLTLPARSVTTFVTEAFNRPPSALSLSGATLPENAPAGTVVGVVSATDADPLENVSYALVAGAGDTDNASFALLGSQLRSVAPLDFEAGATRSIRIRVVDMAGASFERAFTITLLNDEAEYADWSATLPAGQRAPELDPDGDGAANLVAYALGGAPGAGGEGVAAETALHLVVAIADEVAGEGGAAHVELTLPQPFARDVECVLERSGDLGEWTSVATKRGAGEWSGEAPFAFFDGNAETRTWRFASDLRGGRVFHRLRFVLMANTP